MSHKKSVLSFSSMRLNARFGILLGGMALVSLVLFVVYSVYAQRSAEDQFVGQGRVLANALALQVNFDMIMGDDEGMIERLDVLLEGGAVKGGIFRDSKGSEVTAKGLEGELRRAKAPVDDVVWEIDATDDVVNSRMGRDFLVKNAAGSGITLLAPDEAWVEAGAHLAVFQDGSSVRLKVNKRSADAASLTIPDQYLERTDYLAVN